MFPIKKVVCATSMLLLLSQVPAYAEPGVMLGLSLNFGGGESRLGATAKVLSDNRSNEFVGAAGVTYFFDNSGIGLDAGIGRTFDGGAITFTYDFVNKSPQLSAGFINTVC